MRVVEPVLSPQLFMLAAGTCAAWSSVWPEMKKASRLEVASLLRRGLDGCPRRMPPSRGPSSRPLTARTKYQPVQPSCQRVDDVHPIRADWWRTLKERGEICASFDNQSGDRGEKILKSYVAGDRVIAYASRHGAIGWGIIEQPASYRLLDIGDPGDIFPEHFSVIAST